MIPRISLAKLMQHSDGKGNNSNICLHHHEMKMSTLKKVGL